MTKIIDIKKCFGNYFAKNLYDTYIIPKNNSII